MQCGHVSSNGKVLEGIRIDKLDQGMKLWPLKGFDQIVFSGWSFETGRILCDVLFFIAYMIILSSDY